MGLVNIAKKIKEVHPNSVIIYKSGAFYKAFGKDAYILSGTFDYQIKIVEQNVPSCGFPLKAIMRVRSTLEELQISYIIIDQRNNYDIDVSEDFRNLNKYDETFENSYSKVKKRKKIKQIANKLEKIIDEPDFKITIKRIEEIINENREIQNN